MKHIRPGNPIQRRMTSFGLNMIVMAISLMLYYLGFFGGVEGPLNTANIGKAIAGLGVTSNGFQMLLLIAFIFALTWNWVINLVAHLAGLRLTCSAGSKEKGFCGQLVQRSRDPKGQGWVYTCPDGHCAKVAHFHPVKKGMLANSLLMVSLAACMMYYIR